MSLSHYKDQLSNHLRNPWALSIIAHTGLLLLVVIMAYSRSKTALRLSKSRTHAVLVGRISLPGQAARKFSSTAKKMPVAKKIKEVKKKLPTKTVSPLASKQKNLVSPLPALPKVSPLPALKSENPRVTPLPPEPLAEPVQEVKRKEIVVKAQEEPIADEPLVMNPEGQQECISVIDALICHEFQKYWQAPDGVPHACTWLLHISPQGTCSKIEWVEQEPVPAMAIAIRAACAKIAYPRQLWGKTKLVSL